MTLYNSPSLGSYHSWTIRLATRGRNSVTQSVVMVTASYNLLFVNIFSASHRTNYLCVYFPLQTLLLARQFHTALHQAACCKQNQSARWKAYGPCLISAEITLMTENPFLISSVAIISYQSMSTNWSSSNYLTTQITSFFLTQPLKWLKNRYTTYLESVEEAQNVDTSVM